ncbi:hypothetical protein GmHk_19G054265 [Glycine max]|nr:hypothetical protein GmHk_19G054265 [Glycine max]
MSKEHVLLDEVVIFLTNFGPTPINYAPSVSLTEDHVQEMIENEQFWLSMQNTINTQLFNLSIVLLHNLQQANMFMLSTTTTLAIQPPLTSLPLSQPTLRREGGTRLIGTSSKEGKTRGFATNVYSRKTSSKPKKVSTNFKNKRFGSSLRTGKVLAPHAFVTRDDNL